MPLCEGCILNASGGIGGKSDVFLRFIAGDALYQADRPNGDQVLLIDGLGVVFLGRVKQKEKNSGNPPDRRLSRDVEGKWCTTTR